jgi:threonine synthase
VAVCTGHGLKDPDIIVKSMPTPQLLAVDLHLLEEAILA